MLYPNFLLIRCKTRPLSLKTFNSPNPLRRKHRNGSHDGAIDLHFVWSHGSESLTGQKCILYYLLSPTFPSLHLKTFVMHIRPVTAL